MWYVVYKGYEKGICGDTYTLAKRTAGYEGAIYHKYSTRSKAEEAWNRHLAKQVKLPPQSTRDLSVSNIPYDKMPRYKGEITPIPNLYKSYQLIYYTNPYFDYDAYIVYNHRDVYWYARQQSQSNQVWKILEGLNLALTSFKHSAILLPYYGIAKTFEMGWLARWMREATPIDNQKKWAELYYGTLRNDVQIAYQSNFMHKDLVESLVQIEIFRRYYRHLEKVNKQEHERLRNLYQIQCKFPDRGHLQLFCLTDKCNYSSR